MRLVTRGTAICGIGALVLAVWSCETTRNPGGIQRDVTAPAILLVKTAGAYGQRIEARVEQDRL